MEPETGRRSNTRRRILTLLCIEDQTAAQLAARIGITTNAVREQLGRLASDGLIQHEVIRGGVGKPAHQYRLTSDGEAAVSSGYLLVLQELVAELHEGMDPRSFEATLRRTGVRLAASLDQSPEGDVYRRARAAAAVLTRLGGVASARSEEGQVTIHCECCAIGALVAAQPSACKMMEATLSAYLERPVEERCERSGRPKCCFEVGR